VRGGFSAGRCFTGLNRLTHFLEFCLKCEAWTYLFGLFYPPHRFSGSETCPYWNNICIKFAFLYRTAVIRVIFPWEKTLDNFLKILYIERTGTLRSQSFFTEGIQNE
jgi:hypothetical protein